MMIAPTKIAEDIRQLLALRELMESITPSDLPVSLTFLRSGDVAFLEQIDQRIIRIQAEIMAKRASPAK